MKTWMKQAVSGLLAVCLVFGLCSGLTVGVQTAEAATLNYTDAAPTISNVTLTKTNKTSTMLQSYTSDQGETVYNENYEYTYPTYSATFSGTPALGNVTDYVDNMKTGHPRLYVEDFGVYIERADTDYMSRQFYKNVISAADGYLDKEPYLFYMNIRDNINDYSGNIEQRVVTLAMAYNLEKKKVELGRSDAVADYEKYADRAIEELLNAAAYPHWSQDAFLCTAEISVAFAIGYDWLYDYLLLPKNAEALQTIKDTIYKMSIVPYAYHYSKKSYWGTNNWNEVCNGSGIVTAIAFYDAEDSTGKYSTLCEYMLESAAHYLHKGIVQYQDGGFFREGIGYWGYATEYLTRGMAAYQGALANKNYVLPNRFRHIEAQGVAETPNFPIYMNGVTGVLNFGDCGSSMSYSWIMYWFANYLDKPEYASYINNFLQLNNKTFSNEDAVCALLWYVPQETDFDTLSKLPLDKAHVSEDDVNILTMRSSFEVNASHTDNAFVGMQGGNFDASHLGMSLGSFVLDMNGKRFVKTLGAGNYVWPGYFSTSTVDSQRYTYYCMRGEGNNTLIVDPGYSGEMSKSAFVKLIDSGSSKNTAYGVMDLTSTNEKFEKYYRGIMLTDNRRRVVVQDEIQATSDAGTFNDVYWHAHTGDADVVISEDGKSATITVGTQSIVAKITRSNGTFEWVNAEPLPTSPNPEIQQARMAGYGKKLRIHLTNVKSAVIRVEFSPLDKADENVPYALLANWESQLSDEVGEETIDTYLSTKNYETEWYKDNYSTYYIHDDKDLAGLAYMVNSGKDFAGKTVKLVNDITLNSTLQWEPIGTQAAPFKGTFDGSQKTISGLYYNNASGKHVGLFGEIDTATVKNLRLNNASITSTSDSGVLAGTVKNSTIYNIYVDGSAVRSVMRLGGMVGTQFGGSIKNCGVSAKVFGTGMNIGGIVGYTTGEVDNCAANAQLSEFTQTVTKVAKTTIALNENNELVSTTETTTTTVHNGTGKETVKVTTTEPVIVTEGEVGVTETVTGPTTTGIPMGGSYGGIAGLSVFGDVKNSYYLYVTTLVPGAMQAFSNSSANISHSCGKYTANYNVSTINSANPSTLNYISNGKSLAKVLNTWIDAQENKADYITWTDHTPAVGYAKILSFVPEEVVDENNNKELFEISDAKLEDGKISFIVNNLRYATNTGYLAVTITNTDGTKAMRIVGLDMASRTALPQSVDAANAKSAKIFVLDSFITMKIKSNIAEL